MNLSLACQHLLKKEKDILTIILCGSRARGDFKENSDYDLMVITQYQITQTSRQHFEIEDAYISQIAKKTKIAEQLIQLSLWSYDYFDEEYKKGNSFVYCTLRDGKILASRNSLTLTPPRTCYQAGRERLNKAIENIKRIKFSLDNFESAPTQLELEDLGYTSMHLCWAVCMLNNFCPLSKYTVLDECEIYFRSQDFNIIKETYQLYANQNRKKMKKEIFEKLFNVLKKIIEKVEEKYVQKEEVKNVV